MTVHLINMLLLRYLDIITHLISCIKTYIKKILYPMSNFVAYE
ncbi:unnamed protein product [Spirodela intermedia]|uniref:Uncharacterized protein n=1 Tax=Spirodela intermedia TaxID=51605 RepID=A0A7I8LAH2_SPIIN|nr:unnamed protein product [Spirodela intermedia]